MKLTYITFLIVTLFSTCTIHKELKKPKEEAPEKKAVPVDKDPLTPFTSDLFYKLQTNNVDIKRVQFYVDQELVLNKSQQNANILVDEKGTIVTNSKNNVNEIVIPANTPGVCVKSENSALWVIFDQNGGSPLRFQNIRSAGDNFFLCGRNWKNGACEIDYNNAVYKMSCGTCNNAADAKLLVKQSFKNDNDGSSIKLQGVKIGN